ncbi:hypothetical protein A2276_05855 [candidate division WOR-1 bacterium RIFOXYA12_FULL_43_27]|uniref:Uncharacterized protein n=1 Tax=candidate division WOR-1 bacterium RIFOXYC2_FULL_46_14 TaxID=1802587 RepID=A0A1F4U3C4_UNCSA|nr:MAG: hypothetical protein A2276_05855 [candidate division WOR-1 bacterium RIFOXYA12_FULL_43_27]OGC20186.1 MAG: hypothetical protein A2292_03855 [candidate division WOR-1 bacterium RIFOXYB2_FULL_46_45]OGC32076.1 MAG: hypothetical protein A2232_07590 [candidate division WOR-1 bacterium RIFOXYA2_FULL_46_56]OGC39478.1 MAG: hypothetical protein A2438_07955 [candidate division WOR-1 bacterium RIFOXYC2_FULL_46_14]
MKVVLVAPPIPTITTSNSPSVGLAYLAAVLLQLGAEVEIISSAAEGLDAKATAAKVLSARPDILGFSISTPAVNNSLKIIKDIISKNNGIKIIVGGPHPTLFPDEFLDHGADVVVRGEGEKTFAVLYTAFEGGGSLAAINGISYKNEGRTVHRSDQELIANLDSLPFPVWELFHLERFKNDFRKNVFILPIVSSRGCPACCAFCYKGIFGSRFRARSPQNVVAEINYLIDRFRIEEFAIIDDNFTAEPKRAIAICDLIMAKKIKIPWSLPAGIRVPNVSLELLKKLKAAGCYRVALGVESGNQQILNSINKGITLEQVRKAVKLFKEAGLESVANYMIGNLEETEAAVEQTIKLAIELDTDYVQFAKAIPYPGTKMYEQLKKEGRIIAGSWDNYDPFLNSKPIFRHKNLTNNQINAKYREAYRRFYFRPSYLLKRLMRIRSLEDLGLVRNGLKLFRNILNKDSK